MHDRLWEERGVSPQIFMSISGMDISRSQGLMAWLISRGLVDVGGKLTPAFCQAEEALRKQIVSKSTVGNGPLSTLPAEYASESLEILNCLLMCGPISPYRVV
jgi:hypothetical protein